MRVPARYMVVLVALGLVVLAAGSGYAYLRMRPAPLPSQVIYGSGRIEADEVRVGAEVPGRLLENRALEGQTINAGDLLVRIDPSDYELQTQRAAAQRSAALRAAAQIGTQIGLASHHAMSARTDLARYEALRRAGWVSIQHVEMVRNTTLAAKDEVTTLQQRRDEAAAQAEAAAATLALARSQVDRTRVANRVGGKPAEARDRHRLGVVPQGRGNG